MERQGLPYVRYMDDWVILAKTRWALRRVVQQVNTILDHLKLEKHPDKTFIGRIDRGFEFLGYRFVAAGLRLAAQTKQRFVERATRLYEQGAATSRIGEYVRHWLTWVRSGGVELVWVGTGKRGRSLFLILVVLLTKLDLNSRCVFCKPLPHLVVRPRPLHGAGITMIVFWP